jgi:hypothetical protein
VNIEILQKPALVLLTGTFGISIIVSIRKGESVHHAFEKLIVGYLAITFYADALQYLALLGKELESYFATLGSQDEVKAFVAKALYNAATTYTGASALPNNMMNYLLQVFRTGVWGILSSITELLFVVVHFLLEVTRDALWQIIAVLFPLSAAMFPVAPKVLIAMSAVALELALWMPILTIINIATSAVARQYSTINSDFGFYVLALEVVTIFLTLKVPSFTHKMLSGSLAGDVIDPSRAVGKGLKLVTSLVSRAGFASSGTRRSRGFSKKRFALIILAGALATTSVYAKEPLRLRLGFVKKLECRGKLYLSSIGDSKVVELEALPPTLGCAAVLKPKAAGSTNLILETSSGSSEYEVVVTGRPAAAKQKSKEKK